MQQRRANCSNIKGADWVSLLGKSDFRKGGGRELHTGGMKKTHTPLNDQLHSKGAQVALGRLSFSQRKFQIHALLSIFRCLQPVLQGSNSVTRLLQETPVLDA